MATTKGVRKYAMVVLMITFMVSACHQKEVLKREVVHDTVFVDNSLKKKVDTVFYDSKRLRNRFETAKWKKWRNYKDSIAVEYPEFMKYMPDSWERKLHVEYDGISMLAVAYDDESDMSVLEKYKAVNMGAVTKSVSQNSFLLAGSVGDRKLFFEKDIKLKNKKWLYLRVEFPSELTWAIDPLLQYVLDYQVSFLLFAGDS
jgi:hypothetical protein